ncbi:hypothetical protein QBC34DRAFT_102523 [Podospora aff. communis PSN243]|uniref:BHLH domain-containing protein n=1 Tax=Podospora aff. communis PSN243 TaxID=3040156 RepID=A0AAV9GN24_9PEZI|nr:hypothetical protein QBC34DRAFT_102523 [Podospora aff. communis PSN243]
MDGRNGGHLIQPHHHGMAAPLQDAQPRNFRVLPWHHSGRFRGGSNLDFRPYESNPDANDCITAVDESSTVTLTQHGHDLARSNYMYQPTPDNYATTLQLSPFQHCADIHVADIHVVAGAYGGLASSPISLASTVDLDFPTSPFTCFHHHGLSHDGYSLGTGTSSENASLSSDGYNDLTVPCNSLSSTPAPSPALYSASLDAHPDLSQLHHPSTQPALAPAATDDPIHVPCRPNPSSDATTSSSSSPTTPPAAAATTTTTTTRDKFLRHTDPPPPTTTTTTTGPRLRKPKQRQPSSRRAASRATRDPSASSQQPSAFQAPNTHLNTITTTTTTTTTTSAPSSNLPLDPDHVSRLRARIKHNRVEKRYRSRLSDKFARLLSVLPADRFRTSAGSSCGGETASEGEGGGGGDASELSARKGGGNLNAAKSVTRAEVLDMAVRYIEEWQRLS